MSGRKRQPASYVLFALLVGILRASASMLGDPTSEEDVMKLWNLDSDHMVTAADLQSANHPANEWIIKLKSSFAGAMEAVCGWEKQGQRLQKQRPTLLSSVSGAVAATKLQAAEVQDRKSVV